MVHNLHRNNLLWKQEMFTKSSRNLSSSLNFWQYKFLSLLWIQFLKKSKASKFSQLNKNRNCLNLSNYRLCHRLIRKQSQIWTMKWWKLCHTQIRKPLQTFSTCRFLTQSSKNLIFKPPCRQMEIRTTLKRHTFPHRQKRRKKCNDRTPKPLCDLNCHR